MNKCYMCQQLTKNKNVIYEDERVKAFLSKEQVTHGRTIIIYKKHKTQFTKLSEKERNKLMNSVVKIAKLLEKKLKPDRINYLLLNNYHKHLHWHLLPRYKNEDKDDFFFKTGLEPCHLGKEIKNRYKTSSKKLKELAKKIQKA
ncbi:HIT domain-containing protein [archaeon]|nr:HIT domain-containing protein [archaeon]